MGAWAPAAFLIYAAAPVILLWLLFSHPVLFIALVLLAFVLGVIKNG